MQIYVEEMLLKNILSTSKPSSQNIYSNFQEKNHYQNLIFHVFMKNVFNLPSEISFIPIIGLVII